MKALNILFLSISILSASSYIYSQSSFQVVPLGIRGGTDESNLSAYMLAPVGRNEYICLDAGTVHTGIKKAIALNTFHEPPAVILRKYIKGFFISHGHLDHLAGMIINSPDDSVKNIYALPFVLDILKEKYFSWKSWANFADAGEAPLLKKYHYVVLDTAVEIAIANTNMSVKTFVLSHVHPYQSSAFLIQYNENYVLYLGDTGADTIEHSQRLRQLWQAIAPLINDKKLKGIFIETSFPDEQPDKQLFGHLTPHLLMNEMKVLSGFCKNPNALNGLPVIITHIKPNGNSELKIKTQLAKSNSFKLKLIFPQQGKKINL
ncbi:MAG: 3',5'-cyclic-nucleotide phosphodiesterase [Chitinophagaceae bacterium]